MQPLLSPYELPPGSTLDRYRIIRRLAVGGMAEIYLACATGLEGFEKRVVLKRILPQFAARPEFVGMFLDEARLAATLHHPNIAQVYDIGSDGESYYFTMEYVEGRDVRHIRKRAFARDEDVPLDHAVSIAMGIAAGLHHAHEKRSTDGTPLGIVHRDVSPANVIVTYDGTVKLIDFGIAKASRRQTQTRTGILKGKACSMSPEQCLGEPLDRRSDIFSLGILLYELSTATRLFPGDSEYETMKMIVNGKIEAPSRRRPEYPDKLEHILLRALERDPADRYQSAQELFLDLDVFARDERMAVSPYSLAAYVEHLFPADSEQPEEGSSPPLFLLGNDAELPPGLLAAPSDPSIDIEFTDEESVSSGVREQRAMERAETVELSHSGVSLPRAESDPGAEPSGSSPRARTITLVPSERKRRATSERERSAKPARQTTDERSRAASPELDRAVSPELELARAGDDRRLPSEVGTSLVKVKSNRAPSTPIFQRRLSLVVLSASVAVALGILGLGLFGGGSWLSADGGATAVPSAAAVATQEPAPAPEPAAPATPPSATVVVPPQPAKAIIDEPPRAETKPAPAAKAKKTERRAHREHAAEPGDTAPRADKRASHTTAKHQPVATKPAATKTAATEKRVAASPAADDPARPSKQAKSAVTEPTAKAPSPPSPHAAAKKETTTHEIPVDAAPAKPEPARPATKPAAKKEPASRPAPAPEKHPHSLLSE